MSASADSAKEIKDTTGVSPWSFMPPGASNYRLRRQPKPHYYSTVEAIHHVIEHFNPSSDGGGYRRAMPHDNLLKVFNAVVARQLAYAPQG